MKRRSAFSGVVKELGWQMKIGIETALTHERSWS
jgi:hypothetical protein